MIEEFWNLQLQVQNSCNVTMSIRFSMVGLPQLIGFLSQENLELL